MYSKTALKLYAMVSEGVIKSKAMFWKMFGTREKIESFEIDIKKHEQILKTADFNLVCCFDANFPQANGNIKQSEKPFLFAYKGYLSLLGDIKNNVAVVGVLTPSEDIIDREEKVITSLVSNKLNIISGLASGCDTIAHRKCLNCGGKTVAFLPTTLDNIYPSTNRGLVEDVLKSGGLIITEYVTEPKSRGERIGRFIERDRLQAMFAKAVVLIASYSYGKGDSGSRHAMQKAKEYGKKRFVLYNPCTDANNPLFGLNKQLLDENAEILTQSSLEKEVTKCS